MTNATLILYTCKNETCNITLRVEPEDMFTKESALERFNDYILQTPIGKQHPEYIKDSVVEEKPEIIEGVLLTERTLNQMI